MTTDNCQTAFEDATETYYEGEFHKYADGSYVSERQQGDYTMFQEGFRAGRKVTDGMVEHMSNITGMSRFYCKKILEDVLK